ncbi:MAG: hypothetical protein DCF20_11075 [Pseudanabaena sp.]|nr:MAG: hypothetical protein DCF20_11075 [Pseudanabaena sp.]
MAAITAVTIAQPVQSIEEGLYWGGGSRYITVSRRVTKEFGTRVCYSGFSQNGSMIASLSLKIPREQTGIDYEVYTLDGVENNLAVQQYAFKRDQITFGKLVGRFVSGGLVYKREGDTQAKRSPELQECLNSNKQYFKQISSGRDRR